MAELLATAADAEAYRAYSWPRVHALNCLKAAFQVDGQPGGSCNHMACCR
jgi:hypothetical protein